MIPMPDIFSSVRIALTSIGEFEKLVTIYFRCKCFLFLSSKCLSLWNLACNGKSVKERGLYIATHASARRFGHKSHAFVGVLLGMAWHILIITQLFLFLICRLIWLVIVVSGIICEQPCWWYYDNSGNTVCSRGLMSLECCFHWTMFI